jgi:hypothetical protein
VTALEHPGDKLSAYLDGELPPAERAAVDQHLVECAACARALEELAAVDSFSRTLAVQAPEGYFDAFPARVRRRLVARRRRVPAWTWAAAAAVLLAVLTPLTLRDRPAEAPASVGMKQAEKEPDLGSTAPVAAPSPAPPPTLNVQIAERLRAYGYAGGASAPAAKEQAELRQKRDGAFADRLRERDGDAGASGRANVNAYRREALDDAKLKSEAGNELKKGQLGERAGADKPRQDAAAAGAPAAAIPESVLAPTPPPPAAREDESGAKDRRAEPAAAKPAPPAAPARDQGYADAPRPAEGTLGVTKSASGAAPARTVASGDVSLAQEFEAQAARPVRTAEDARAAARQWEELARRHPGATAADEANVRAIEALATAFRLEKKDADRDRARKAAQAYLAGNGAHKDRVRAVLDQLGR